MKKVLFYTNQFFGQIGGEAEAYQKPFIEQGARGNAQAFVPLLEDAEIVATIVCGDNYYAENMDEQSRPPRTVCCFWRPAQPTPMSP